MSAPSLPLIASGYQINTIQFLFPDDQWNRILPADPRRYWVGFNSSEGNMTNLWPGGPGPDLSSFCWPLTDQMPRWELYFCYHPGLIGVEWWAKNTLGLVMTIFEIIKV